MLEVDPVDLLPFERVESLATAAHASITLQHFTDSRRLYPNDLDRAEAKRIHELVCWFLEVSLAAPVWAKVDLGWVPVPFDPPVCPDWVLAVSGASILLCAETPGLETDVNDPAAVALRFEAHVAPTLAAVESRVSEILLFDMMIPHAADEPEFADPRRALFVFDKDWDAYRSILDQRGAAFMGRDPHPMSRIIASLRHRLLEYAARIADPPLEAALADVLAIELSGDALDAWEGLAQPYINRLQQALEEPRIRRQSATLILTHAEKLFLHTTAATLASVDREARARWYAVMAIAARGLVNPNWLNEPVPGFRHSPDFRSVRLHEVTYPLTTQQAQVVQMLLDVHLNGTPEVSQAYILERLGSTSGELRNTFRGSDAWGTLIVAGKTRGSFRLNV